MGAQRERVGGEGLQRLHACIALLHITQHACHGGMVSLLTQFFLTGPSSPCWLLAEP